MNDDCVGCWSPQGALQKMMGTLTNALTHSKEEEECEIREKVQ